MASGIGRGEGMVAVAQLEVKSRASLWGNKVGIAVVARRSVGAWAMEVSHAIAAVSSE